MNRLTRFCLGLLLLPVVARAEVDKIYDPYVYRGELELEARGVHRFAHENEHELKFAAGYGMTDWWFLEGYAVVEQESGDHAKIRELELENKFQLTQQGRYWADLGAQVEVEKGLGEDRWELKAGPLLQKQIGNWLATANFFVEKQFGRERETSAAEFMGAARIKYRLSPELEPAIEYYADAVRHSLGPVLSGTQRIGKTPLKWEAGILAGLNHDSPDVSLRWSLEFEFY